jgi:hypothetical protein
LLKYWGSGCIIAALIIHLQLKKINMKRIFIILIGVLSVNLAVAQVPASKIALAKGQKIQGEMTMTTEASLMGMDVQSSSSSQISLEVKTVMPTSFIFNNTLQKLKMNMDMPGKTMSYDSEKPEDQGSDLGKAFGSKMNVPVEVTVDNTTGKMIDEQKDVEEKTDDTPADPMESMMQLFGAANDVDPVSGAFIVLPQGKKIGDSWSDSTVAKNSKTVRTYTLKSIDGKEAVVQVNTTTDATGDVEMMGTQMNVVTNAKTTGDITTDISTALVKKKNMTTETTGNLQVAGQDIPISSKTIFTATYK